MNCHHARQLISPYLDQQLTGREMLALQGHFRICASCEREVESIRQVKLLLRGLREPGPPRDFHTVVALRLEQAETQPWRALGLTNFNSPKASLPVPRPQRGRRLASALVLSCVTVVSFALPFAPEAHNAARSSSALFGPRLDVSSFAAPSASDVLSGQVPGRITLVPVNDAAQFNDLAHLSPAAASMPSPGALTLTGFEATSFGPGAEVAPRDAPFGSAEFAQFKAR